VQMLSKTQTELLHTNGAVAKSMNSWLPKPFGASRNPIGIRRSGEMLSKIRHMGKVILDKSETN